MIKGKGYDESNSAAFCLSQYRRVSAEKKGGWGVVGGEEGGGGGSLRR